MSLFIYMGRDSDRAAELRPSVRPQHLEHLQPLDRAGRIRFAGPLLDEAERPCGSVIVFEAGDLDEARAIAQADPYAAEGVFETVEVFATKGVFPSS